MTQSPTSEAEILIGYKSIARALGITPAQCKWHAQRGVIPTFNMGHSVAARKVTLLKWLEDQEQQSTHSKKARGK